MEELSKTYPPSFFRRRYKEAWRAELFCPPILEILKPRSLIDVGCGIGDFVKWFLNHKINAFGLEGTAAVMDYVVIPTERMFYGDLRRPLSIPAIPRFDLAMSIEVAEHIEPEHAANYIHNLACFSDNLLLSIAGPGQLGHSHVNLQPKSYWDELFMKFNYVRFPEIENNIKECLYAYQNKRWIKAVSNNLVFYKKGGNS